MSHQTKQGWLWAGGVTLTLLLGAALGTMPLALLRQPADFSIYYAAARVLAQGGDPYNWHALQRVVPHVIPPGYVYPIWSLLPALAVAWLPLPVAAGIWLAASCSCLAYCVWTLGALAGLPVRSLWLPALLGLVLLSIPGLFVLIQGQVSLLLLAAVVGAYATVRRGHPRWTGVLLALALAKPQLVLVPALAIVFVAWHSRQLAAVARWGSGALAALVALSFAIRPGWLVGWVAALGADAAQGGSGTATLRANMGTVPALAAHLPAAVGALLIVLSLAAGCWLLFVLARRMARQATTQAEMEMLAAAACVATVLSPWMWIFDGVFWLVALVVIVRWANGWRRWLGLAAYGALPWVVRLWHVAASPHGGTSLNKIEDVLIAPLLLVALHSPAGLLRTYTQLTSGAATQASASPPATPRHLRARSTRRAASFVRAHRPATGSPRQSPPE